MPARKHERVAPDEVRRLLEYCPETGVLTWTGRHSIRIPHAGATAGTIDRLGYVLISIKYRRVRGHTLAWVLMTGEYPTGEIDHINGDKGDNRWANLRDTDHDRNMQNLKAAKRNNPTGLLGVTSHSNGKHFTAQIQAGGRRRYLGCFGTPEEAHAAYMAAKKQYHVTE